MDNILLKKVSIIERCLLRIEEHKSSIENLANDYDKQDIIVLNLERAIQACIDCAQYIVKQNKLGIPQFSREAFDLIEKKGIIKAELSIRLKKMVGFRNIVVHSYQDLNIEILEQILANELSIFTEFSTSVIDYAKTK